MGTSTVNGNSGICSEVLAVAVYQLHVLKVFDDLLTFSVIFTFGTLYSEVQAPLSNEFLGSFPRMYAIG